jgi:hypothetical protein
MEEKNMEQLIVSEGTTDEQILSEDLTTETKVYTQAEIDDIRKKMQADSERGVQKLIKEKKIFEKAMDELSKIAEDNEHLLSLHDSNPDVAQLILDKYYDGQSIDEYKNSIGYKEDITNPDVAKRLIESKVRQEVENRTIFEKKNAFVSKLKMSVDEQAQFDEVFSELRQMKGFNLDNLEKTMEKAYRLIDSETDVKSIKQNEAIANAMATGNGGKES